MDYFGGLDSIAFRAISLGVRLLQYSFEQSSARRNMSERFAVRFRLLCRPRGDAGPPGTIEIQVVV